MAGSSEDGRRRRGEHRRCPADLRDADEAPEEGELVPGSDDSDMNTEDYYNTHRPTDDTDETTSNCNYARSVVPTSYGGAAGPSSSSAAAASNSNGNASSSPVVAAAPPAEVLACPICGKEFRSRKAFCGHMKVHQKGTGTIGRHEQPQAAIGKDRGIKRSAAIMAHWGGTGKRGCARCWSKPASPVAQSDQSMAVVVVANPETVLQPMPLAFAMPVPMEERPATPNPSSVPTMASGTPDPSSVPISSTTNNASDDGSSAKPMHSDAIPAMETVVAGAASTPTEADGVHLADAARAPPPPSPSPPPAEVHAASVHEQPIEPPPPPPPAAADAEEERAQLPPAAHHQHTIALAPTLPGRQNPNGYTCKQCGQWFSMHQGLGGHMAGHKTRELAAAVPCQRDAKPEKVHVCRICDAVFPAGVQLGGHMRKHYTGEPIVPKKKPRPVGVVQPLLPPPAEQRAPELPPRTAVPGSVILFGVNIAAAAPQTMPAAREEGESSESKKEEGSSVAVAQPPSASTGGEQQ